MTNTASHAKKELDILEQLNPDAVILPFKDELLSLCEKFGNSGQSGGSAPYVSSALAQAVRKFCLQEPICPIMGIDDEWNVTMDSNTLRQNNRCYSLFKEGDNGKPYYLDAIIWKTENGSTWSGRAKRADGTSVSSRQYIQSFPFTPKKFVINVREVEVAKDDWDFYILDEKQLEEVFAYYDEYTH